MQSLYRSREKRDFLRVAVIRAVRLQECRLGELALHALHSLSCHSFTTLTDYEMGFRELPPAVSFEHCCKSA